MWMPCESALRLTIRMVETAQGVNTPHGRCSTEVKIRVCRHGPSQQQRPLLTSYSLTKLFLLNGYYLAFDSYRFQVGSYCLPCRACKLQRCPLMSFVAV